MPKLIRTRPLGGRSLNAVADAALSLSEVPYRGLVNFRLDPADAHMGLLSASLQIKLPTAANTTTQSETARCLWLGPDEWLIINTAETGAAMLTPIAEAMGQTHYSAKDVSDNFQTMRLEGAQARHILSKLTPLDVHRSVFTDGQCAQTVMAKSAVILDVIDDGADGPTFEITTRRSFAPYLWDRILDAGLEFGLQITDFPS